MGGFGAEPSHRVPEKVLEKVWDALVRCQVRFNREGSGEGLRGFGAELGSGSTGFWRRFR